MNNEELLPCPFCGGEPIKKFIGNDHTKKRSVEIKCSRCFTKHVVGAIRNTEEFEKKLVELYDKHKNMHRVSEITGKPVTAISRALKRLGVEVLPNKDGAMHPGWKGGVNEQKGDGYRGIWCPGHERADGGNYVFEHTLVYEKNTGKLPKKNEVLHHIDLDKKNNEFDNLYLCGHKEHLVIHRQIEKLIKPLMKMGIVVFDNGEYKIKATQ